MITVKNWTALESVYRKFNKDAFNNRYIDSARSNGNSTEYAFLALFANALYLYKAPAGSAEFEPLELKLNDTSDIMSTSYL
ncbi:hypothetical protein EV200_104159 [Pedobacter psychrotolerans]|uniref:Uncharacterized protein n=1 Tax=Pedobacter psychrotolerans TaxID=1843235 RepID=A0A4R2HE17_9SPHI|nr:hypothetical protein EV200_104159 [Pedobacter psychrotolerans]GGE47957.1 hypothetical protein GCM10011413_12530 [Pedobacter psychrotolerans]